MQDLGLLLRRLVLLLLNAIVKYVQQMLLCRKRVVRLQTYAVFQGLGVLGFRRSRVEGSGFRVFYGLRS